MLVHGKPFVTEYVMLVHKPFLTDYLTLVHKWSNCFVTNILMLILNELIYFCTLGGGFVCLNRTHVMGVIFVLFLLPSKT